MSDYIHDEWCDTGLEMPGECNCYVAVIRRLEARIDEVERLREIELADFDRAHGEMVKQLLAAQARIEVLEKIAVLAGEKEDRLHDWSCRTTFNPSNRPDRAQYPCDCGVDALFAALAQEKHIAPPATATEIQSALGCTPEDIEAANAALATDAGDTPKLVDLGGGLSSYENLGRNPPEKRAALAQEKSPYSTREGMNPVERLIADAEERKP